MRELAYKAAGRASVWLERAVEPLIVARALRAHREGGSALDRTGRWLERAQPLPVLFRDAEVVWAEWPHPAQSLWRAQELSLFHQHRAAIEAPLLDFGCGDGAFASVLFERIDLGVDLDADALAIARDYGIYRRVERAGEARIPAAEASARSAIANSVLEHTSALDAVLDELRRVLAPGGRLLFTVPVAAFGEHLAKWFGRAESERVNVAYYHRNLFLPQEWGRRLASHGFEVERVRHFQPDWYTYWYRMFRFCGRRGLGRLPRFRERLWRRYGRKLVEMVRRSVQATRDGEGANIFIIARRAP